MTFRGSFALAVCLPIANATTEAIGKINATVANAAPVDSFGSKMAKDLLENVDTIRCEFAGSCTFTLM